MKFADGFSEDRDAVSSSVVVSCPEGDDVTQQQFKEETDINVIVTRFGVTGTLPMTAREPLPDDLYEPMDLLEAMQRVRQADEAFAALPAKVRDRFGNDPVALAEFVADPANVEEARALGLLRERAEEAAPVDKGPE